MLLGGGNGAIKMCVRVMKIINPLYMRRRITVVFLCMCVCVCLLASYRFILLVAHCCVSVVYTNGMILKKFLIRRFAAKSPKFWHNFLNRYMQT